MEKKVTTKSKIPIYYYSNDHLHRFCITLYIKAGSMYEKNKNKGITHFWEHMIFRNINNLLDGEMKKIIDRMGAYFNASTCKEYVEVKIIAATKHFDECAKIITMALAPFEISKEDLDIERKRIKAEIREDNEKKSLDYFSQKIIWKNTTLANLITGERENIELMTVKKIKEFTSEILTPANMFFYVTGSFTKDNINNLKRLIDRYDLQGNATIRDNTTPIPKNFFNRDAKVKIKDEKEYCEVRFSFDFDSKKYKRAELDLLYDILFDGECSKIFNSLSEKTGLVYSYDSTLEQYNNIGNLYFSFEIKGKKILDSIDIVITTLKGLKKGIKDELEYVKAPYTVNADMDLDEPEKLNWIMAYESHILEQNYKNLEERIKNYENVSPQRMSAIVNEIFTTKNMVVTLKANKKKINSDDIKKIIDKL